MTTLTTQARVEGTLHPVLDLACLPCPFCGGFAGVFKWRETKPTDAADYGVGCGTRDCRGNAPLIGYPPKDIPAEVAKWNRRSNNRISS